MKLELTSDRIVAFAWIAVLVFVVVANAESPRKDKGRGVASIQYLRVYQLAYVPDNAGFTNQEVDFRIKSILAYLSVESISLFIDGKAGRVPIAIDSNGWFTLPFSKELLAENPEIVSNQPRGSLSLECVVSQTCIVLPKCRAVTYRKLVEPDLLSRTIEAIVDGKNVRPFPAVLSFRLDRPGIGNVVIQAVRTTEKLPVGRKSGFFQIALSSDLMAENPLVVFPGPSRFVYLVEDCGMPRPRLSGCVSNF